MTHLDITLFGSPLISIDGTPLNSRVDKTAALVALLALQGPTLYRDALIANLWTNSTSSKARAALRTAIWRLKDAGLSPWLEIERESITLRTDYHLWVDINEFQNNLLESKSHSHSSEIACPSCFPLLSRAVDLYRGDFMTGYFPRNTTGFDEWRSEFCNILRSEYLNTLERLSKGYYQHGQFGHALQTTRRWLAVDTYNEDAHGLAIRIYASIGQRANAIAQYRTFKHLSEQELKIEPSSELTALYNHVLAGKIPPIVTTTRLNTPILLLLDIARGTELWISYPDLMAEVQTRFTKLIKDYLRQCSARVIHQSGHQFSILFERGSPLQSVTAIQKMVAQSQWGLPEPLSARMALNPIPRSPTQLPLHSTEYTICKQLLYAASGNQILLTGQAIRELEFPVSTRSHDLGSYFIAGYDNPVQVFELVDPNNPSSRFASLPNLTRPPVNFPPQVTKFVGREEELSRLATMLDQPEIRLITLVGPGGVGKTRLGIQVISQLKGNHYNSIHYVPLVNHTNPLTLHEPIAEGLHLAFNNPGDQIVQLKEHLQGKHILLMLDNFEHLLEATSFLIDLLEAAPGLRILLTSRERLNLHMETIFEVHGLPIPQDPNDPHFEQSDAVRLFTQNARRVFPRFTLRAEDRPHIIKICILVDGLPIGIELSSAWVRAISCQEIARSIQKNLDFIESSSQDVPPRHRSLRAAFDHSWNLLSEEDRRIISKLSIFQGGFSATAAEKLANATPAMLASYVDKSILTRQPNGRCFLSETLKTYITLNLKSAPQEYDRLTDAHCEYFLNYLAAVMPKFAGQAGASTIKDLWPDAVNIDAALNWAIDHHQWSLFNQSIDPLLTFFELQGRFRDGLENARKLLERVLNLVGMEQPDIYYSLLGWEGWFAFRLGYDQEGLEKLTTHLEYSQRQGDTVHIAFSLLLLAEAHLRRGNLDLALQEIEQFLALMDEISQPDDSLMLGIRGNGLSLYGLILLIKNRVGDAQQAVTMAAEVLRRSGSRYGLIRLLDVQARLANKDNKYTEGYNLRLEELAIAEEFNDRCSIASALNNLGTTSLYLGDFQAAYNYTIKCAQISDEIGDRRSCAVSNNNLGYYTLKLNYPPVDAIPYYEKSLAMFREMGDTFGIFYTSRDISRAYVLAHRLESAQIYLRQALQLGSELKNPLLILQLLPVIARLLGQTGQADHALQLCSLVLHHPQAETDLQQEAQSLLAEFGGQVDVEYASWSGSSEPTLPTFQALLAVIRGE